MAGKHKPGRRHPTKQAPAGAPWWWPGEQLRLFELPELPAQGQLFRAADECGCSTEDGQAKSKAKRRARKRAA